MKVFKTFMLYFLILIALAIGGLLLCCGLMVFSPNTPIFGYKYVSYKGIKTDNIAIEEGVSAISVTSNRMDIKFIPNVTSNDIYIEYSQGMSGFVKQDAVDLAVASYTDAAKTFESGDSSLGGTTYKTLCIEVQEPEGLIFLNDCYIKVYIPSRAFEVLNAYTKNAGIDYTSVNESKVLNVNNLYLRTDSKDVSQKVVNINYPNCKRYYIRTLVGNCYFINEGADITGSIVFETSGGKLVAKNGAIRSALTVRSDTKVNGATLDITQLNGNLTFAAKSGNISIGTVSKGNAASYPKLDIQSEYCNIKIETLNGTMLTQGFEGGEIDNIDVVINKLHYISGLTSLDINSGKGNITIEELTGNSSLRTITGNINITKATSPNMFVETYNGAINITFDTVGTALSKLDIIVLKRSSINLANLQGTVNIDIEEGSGRDISLGLLEYVSNCTINVTASYDNVILKNVRSTKAAIYSDGEITTIDGPSHSDISQGNSDYYSTKAYPYQKRLNYSAGNPAVKLFVNNRKVTDDAACKVSAYM